MIGRIEETSASFEARSAPRSYPTPFSRHRAAERLGDLGLTTSWPLRYGLQCPSSLASHSRNSCMLRRFERHITSKASPTSGTAPTNPSSAMLASMITSPIPGTRPISASRPKRTVERALDAPAQLVDTPIEAERLFPVAAIWNDRLGSALVQVFAQLGAIVGPVAEHPFDGPHSANEALCNHIPGAIRRRRVSYSSAGS
jgi:hypothetical protein